MLTSRRRWTTTTEWRYKLNALGCTVATSSFVRNWRTKHWSRGVEEHRAPGAGKAEPEIAKIQAEMTKV
eukprot:4682967-Amphidinium_carterae.1